MSGKENPNWSTIKTTRRHKQCDDDSDYDNEPTKTSTAMRWKVLIDNFDGEKLTCQQRVCQQHANRSAKCPTNRRKTAALRKERIENREYSIC